MRIGLLVIVVLLLLLSGLAIIPERREEKNSSYAALVGVCGNEPVKAVAFSQGQAAAEPVLYEGEGASYSEALQSCRQNGEDTLSFAHVEHIILEKDFAEEGLPRFLSASFRNREQSVESRVWVLTEGSVDALLTEEPGVQKQLETMTDAGEEGIALSSLTLRELTARLADAQAVLLPALSYTEEGLQVSGYVAYGSEGVLGEVTGDDADAAQVLQGKSYTFYETIETYASDTAVLQLETEKISFRPVFKGTELQRLVVELRLSGARTEAVGEMEDAAWQPQLEEELAAWLARGFESQQRFGVDALGLMRQMALPEFWRWRALQTQWPDKFASLPVEVDVSIMVQPA